MYQFIEQLDHDEEARPIKGMPKGYFITNKARIFCIGPGFQKAGRWLSPTKAKHPSTYRRQVYMRGKTYNLHRLVGRHFLDGFNESMLVCHRDEELPHPEVNYASNLYLGTHSDNMRDMMSKSRGKSQFQEGHNGRSKNKE